MTEFTDYCGLKGLLFTLSVCRLHVLHKHFDAESLQNTEEHWISGKKDQTIYCHVTCIQVMRKPGEILFILKIPIGSRITDYYSLARTACAIFTKIRCPKAFPACVLHQRVVKLFMSLHVFF